MTQYLGKYVPNLAEVLQSMLELLKKDAVGVWNEPQEKAFQRVEELLTQTPILTYNDPSMPIIIGGARGVMVIIVENGHDDTSSIPGRDWLHFT